MKYLRDAQRLVGLLERRAWSLRQVLVQQREALARLDEQIAANRAATAQLHDRLAHSALPKAYTFRELMCARGKQAVLRFEIACKQVEAADLLEKRTAVQQALRESQTAASALERRKNKHQEWLAQRKLEHDWQRESTAEADIMEGIGYGFNH